MSWSHVGTDAGASGAAPTHNNQAIGNLLICEVLNFSNSTVWATGLTGGGATWVQAGVKFSGTTNAFSAAVFLGTVTATGSATPTITWSGTAPGSFGTAAVEFSSSVGSWSFDKQGNLDSAGTSNWVSLTAASGAGELYFGYAANATTAVSGSTSGYVYNANIDGVNNGMAYNVNCPGTATFPAWGDSGQALGIMVLVAESAGSVGQSVAIASDKWFNRYKRNRKPKPSWSWPPAQTQPALPTFFPGPTVPRRVAVPAMARRRMQPVPAMGLPEDWPQIRRQPAMLARRSRTQFPIQVAAPVVVQPVFMAPRVHVSQLSRQARRQQTMPLRLQVSGPPPAIPQVGSRARWAELRRRPHAPMPLYLQVSGPLPALKARPTRPVAVPQARRIRMASLPPGMPLIRSGRPARRFVAYSPRPVRRQLSLPIPMPIFGKRLAVALPRIGRRQAQLVPAVVVVVQPTVQQQTLPRKAAWFGIRQRRAPQLQITGAPPPLAAAPITGVPPKDQWLGFRWKRTMPVRPFFPVLLVNDAEEGTNGVTVSPANSAGTGENALDNVVIQGSASLTFDNTNVAHGGMAFKVQTANTGETSTARWTVSMGRQQQTWFRVYCFLPATGTSWRVYGARCGAATSAGSVVISSAGQLQIQDSAFGNTIAFTIHPNVGAWFRLEGYIIGHPTQGQISVSLFNNPEGLIPHETQTTTVGYNTFGNTNEYWFGQSANATASGPFWMDDIGISNTGPLGPVGAEGIIPAWLRSRAFAAIPGLRLRRAPQLAPPVTVVAVPPTARRNALRASGVRRHRVTPRIPAVPAPTAQAPARRRFGPPRSRPQQGFVQTPPPAKPPPLGQQGSRARLTSFLRRLMRRSLNIFGQPPPSNFPGFVTITNRQVEPVTISNTAIAVVAITNTLAPSRALKLNWAASVTITNEEVGQVEVSDL